MSLLLVLDLMHLKTVVVEQNIVLRVESILQVLSLKDRLELSEEL